MTVEVGATTPSRHAAGVVFCRAENFSTSSTLHWNRSIGSYPHNLIHIFSKICMLRCVC